MDEYLKLDRLVHKGLYEIDGRNASIGLWDEVRACFHIHREKMHLTNTDTELHWDSHDRYGTVKPIRRIQEEEYTVYISDRLLSELLREVG